MSVLGAPGVLHSAVRALTAGTTLPVFELDRQNVVNSAGRIRPFDPTRGFTADPLCPPARPVSAPLQLSGLRLAHAVIKADRLRRLPFAWLAAIGWLAEHVVTFDWRQPNLRLFPGISDAYADFVGTSLAGRVGQGISLLLMEQLGYPIAGPYPAPSSGHRPDFIVQMAVGHTRALMESKGAFVNPKRNPEIKAVLRDGLSQLSGVAQHGATKAFVVGSFLREAGDPSHEPSLAAFVDPDSVGGTDPVELAPDWVARQNYAAWLDAMGLTEAASDLRTGIRSAEREEVTLPTVRMNGASFAWVPLVPGLPWNAWRYPEPFMFGDPSWRVPMVGLRSELIETIGQWLREPDGGFSPPIPDGVDGWASAAFKYQATQGSTLSDGTLLALVPVRDLLRGGEEIAL